MFKILFKGLVDLKEVKKKIMILCFKTPQGD